ncbi:unnamed protein product [Medioppia subpectinata]|uniref:Insulin-like domain-containing protein n=1 Tax=Medioppia subpectinata TaxID=1979941 RepID=A0A7R9L2S2_9ACAR|nr:unnamed protein product [Medioppia subpectinata]CAG2114215.1 unnamed protein product [Medioppia subpectinata]
MTSTMMFSITNCTKICALILLLVSIAFAFRDPINYMYETHKVETRSSSRQYCGNNLVRALHLICESYNKRSPLPIHSFRLSQTHENNSGPEDENIEGSKYSLSLSNAHNNNHNKYFHRMLRGVVDECCRRSCSITQLSQYCGVTRVTTTTAAPVLEA